MSIYPLILALLLGLGSDFQALANSEGSESKRDCESLISSEGEVTNPGVDESGFINPYALIEGAEDHQLAPPPPVQQQVHRNLMRDRNLFDALSEDARSRFVINRGVFLQDSKAWMQGVLDQDPVALEILEFLAKRSRFFVSRSSVYDRHYNPLRQILKLTSRDLRRLKPGLQIRLLSMFSRWNVIPPNSVLTVFQPVLLQSINRWSADEMREFSMVRIQTVASFGKVFESRYKQLMLQQLQKGDAELVFNMMSSEFLRGTFFTQAQMQQFVGFLSRTLPNLNESVISAQRIKEVYRGLLLHRSQGPMLPVAVFDELLPQFAAALANYDLDLLKGGTSGFSNANHSVNSNFAWVLERIREELNPNVMFEEYTDATRPGFFDPVDIYLPGEELVVEWDGPQHYLRPMLENGNIDSNPEALVLRPMDVAKDRALRMTGVSVFRVDKQQYERMLLYPDVAVLDWIQYQNPNFKLSE